MNRHLLPETTTATARSRRSPSPARPANDVAGHLLPS